MSGMPNDLLDAITKGTQLNQNAAAKATTGQATAAKATLNSGNQNASLNSHLMAGLQKTRKSVYGDDDSDSDSDSDDDSDDDLFKKPSVAMVSNKSMVAPPRATGSNRAIFQAMAGQMGVDLTETQKEAIKVDFNFADVQRRLSEKLVPVAPAAKKVAIKDTGLEATSKRKEIELDDAKLDDIKKTQRIGMANVFAQINRANVEKSADNQQADDELSVQSANKSAAKPNPNLKLDAIKEEHRIGMASVFALINQANVQKSADDQQSDDELSVQSANKSAAKPNPNLKLDAIEEHRIGMANVFAQINQAKAENDHKDEKQRSDRDEELARQLAAKQEEIELEKAEQLRLDEELAVRIEAEKQEEERKQAEQLRLDQEAAEQLAAKQIEEAGVQIAIAEQARQAAFRKIQEEKDVELARELQREEELARHEAMRREQEIAAQNARQQQLIAQQQANEQARQQEAIRLVQEIRNSTDAAALHSADAQHTRVLADAIRAYNNFSILRPQQEVRGEVFGLVRAHINASYIAAVNAYNGTGQPINVTTPTVGDIIWINFGVNNAGNQISNFHDVITNRIIDRAENNAVMLSMFDEFVIALNERQQRLAPGM